jgi:hypothetical protein
MSALSDALAVAQARAVAALAKGYMAGKYDEEGVALALLSIGLGDDIDSERWLDALDIIRDAGGEAPGETGVGRVVAAMEPASDAQWSYLSKLADEKGFTAPEGPLTKDQASEAIDALKNGTYDPDKWTVPF